MLMQLSPQPHVLQNKATHAGMRQNCVALWLTILDHACSGWRGLSRGGARPARARMASRTTERQLSCQHVSRRPIADT